MKKQNLKLNATTTNFQLFQNSAIPSQQLYRLKGGDDSFDGIIVIEDPVN